MALLGRMVTKNNKAFGFSMLELLIVIGIVATVGALMGASMVRLQKQAHLKDVVTQIAGDINKISSDSKRFGKQIRVRFDSNNNRYIFIEAGERNQVTKLEHGVYIKEVKLLNKTVAATTVSYLPPVGEFQNKDTKITFGIVGNDNLSTSLSMIGVTGRVFVE